MTPNYPEYEKIGSAGKQTLWVVFVIMLIATIIFSVLGYRVPTKNRLFHILTTFITLFATISYFAMATGDGISYSKTTVTVKHKHQDTYKDVYRQVFWARYIDWSVTTPLLLLDLALLAGLSGADILIAIVADLVMILTGLFAAFGREGGQKWGYYAIACLAYLVIIYQLAVNGRRVVTSKDTKSAAFFGSIAGFTLIIWTIYPIVWGISDGSRKVSVDAEVLSYAVLDVLAKPVFGLWLLVTHAYLPTTNLHLDGVWVHGFGKREGTLRVGDDDEGA
ncbi:MAG: hypothetical protein M1824_003963 [Vezdaea acicularis]|nr:MAG: hypothetical protein M1824_003963 [Vezdaea acicularis]